MKGIKKRRKHMKVRLVYYLPTMLQYLLSCNSYYPTHSVICKLKRRPTIACRPLIVVAYCLQHL